MNFVNFNCPSLWRAGSIAKFRAFETVRARTHVAMQQKTVHTGAAGYAMRDKTQRDKPWIFRTYAGHSTAADSNALYRKNLAKGQTGLSVAFDLPTQTGYDSTTCWRAARSAKSACRSAISATCARCSTASRSAP